MRKLRTSHVSGIALSFILWYIVFLTEILSSFWYRVTLASIVLAVYARVNSSDTLLKLERKDVIWGLGSGIGLYALFYLGFNVFRFLVERGAVNVYLFRSELSLIIPASLLLVTSFCEEYFWRHYVQTTFEDNQGLRGVIITSILYASIHIPTMNLPLVAAALIAGLFWGTIYKYTGSLWLVVFSHIAWTELIFVLLPLV
jgi:membrane protease YdiL (CAAX protease family)